jgi:hypothetical protein
MLTCTPTIATNHGHELVVTAADVMAGMDKTYDIQGAALHVHSVTLTAADFTTLSQGGTVMKASTAGADHTHMVTVTCA